MKEAANKPEPMEAEPIAPVKELKPVNMDDLTAQTASLKIARKGKKKDAAPPVI